MIKRYEYPIKNKKEWLNGESKTGKAPFFFIFRRLSSNFSEKVALSALLEDYARTYECSLDEAEKVFYLEQGNYHFKRHGDNVYVLCSYSTRIGEYEHYHVLNPQHLNTFCNAKTQTGLRCRQHRNKDGSYCTQHTKSLEEKNSPVSSKKLDRNIIPQFLLDEKDIEKLRDVCITVYMNYHHQWDNIIRLSQKRNKNREALSKINELQLQINKLREELE